MFRIAVLQLPINYVPTHDVQYCPFETNLQAPILCDTSRFFSWEFRLHFFSSHTSVSPLCDKLTAVCIYMGRKSAECRTIKQPPPT